jgi:hypothetical protein
MAKDLDLRDMAMVKVVEPCRVILLVPTGM